MHSKPVPHYLCKLLLGKKLSPFSLFTNTSCFLSPVTGKHTEDAADGRGGETFDNLLLLLTQITICSPVLTTGKCVHVVPKLDLGKL